MKTPTSKPTPRLRRYIASAMVTSYGYLLFLVWAAPLGFLAIEMLEKSPRLAWIAIGMLAVFLFGFQLLPRRLYDLHEFEYDGKLYRRLGVRQIRFFAGMGEGIQRLACRVDPNWQNSLRKLSPEERTNWTTLIEGIHWGMLIGSVPLIALALYLGFTTFGVVLSILNVPLNIYPIMLQRYTRAKLMRIDQHRANRNLVR